MLLCLYLLQAVDKVEDEVDKVDYHYFLAEPVTYRTLKILLSCLLTADSRKAIESKLNFMILCIALK